jgi:hypothetical protein
MSILSCSNCFLIAGNCFKAISQYGQYHITNTDNFHLTSSLQRADALQASMSQLYSHVLVKQASFSSGFHQDWKTDNAYLYSAQLSSINIGFQLRYPLIVLSKSVVIIAGRFITQFHFISLYIFFHSSVE